MRLLRWVILCQCFIGYTIASLHAQSLPFTLEKYGVEQGLSHRKVYGIVEDREGFLWIATEDGLNRYDGYEFRVFGNKLDTRVKFASSVIYHINIDQGGILWLGTSKGVSIFDPHTFQARNIFTTEYPLPNFFLAHQSYIDKKGRVWIFRSTADNSPEIVEFEQYKPTGLIIRPVLQPKREALRNMAYISEDTIGNTWFLFEKEYCVLDTAGRVTHFNYPEIPSKIGLLKKNLLPAFDKALWFYPDLSLYDFLNLLEWVEGNTFPRRQFIHATGVQGTFIVDANEWWSYAWPGFFFTYNGEYQNIVNYSKAFYAVVGEGLIGQIYKSRDDNIWICSENGLFRTLRKPKLFRAFLNTGKSNFYNSCRKILESPDGKILIGTYGGLMQFDGKTTQTLFERDDNNFVPYYLIRDPLQPQVVWAGGEGNAKMHRVDLARKTMKDLVASPGKTFKLATENDTMLWAATTTGLELFNTKTETFTPYQDPAGKIDFGKIVVFEIQKNKKGEIWLGTSVGLLQLDRQKGVQAMYSLKKQEETEIAVLFIYEQNDSIFWLGTRGNGLYRLNRQTGNFRQFLVADGLPNNVIYAILDYGDYLWMSTDNGLSRLYLPTFRFDNFTEADGLAHQEFNNKSYLKASDGTFYFGGINGVTYFNPRDIQLKTSQNQVLITYFSHEDGRTGSLITQDTGLQRLKTIHLGYRDRFFTLGIALSSYTHPEKNTFAYLLEGYESTWNQVGNQRTLRFDRLPPGSYTLKIRGADSTGNWSEAHSIEVVVDAAFYKTWWFFTLCGLAIFGISYAIFRYRLARIREMEQMRTRIASDLHDEVGSILTRIAMQAQLAERKAGEKDKSFLHQVAENSRIAISTMRDVIWTIDSRNDTVGELVERMEDFAHAMLGAAGKSYQFNADTLRRDSDIDVKIRQNLYLVYKEAINNIIKHSNAKNVLVELKNEGSYFYMRIADDGTAKVDAPEETGKGQGLRNMEMRAGRINATLTIQQHDGFEILLKCKAFG